MRLNPPSNLPTLSSSLLTLTHTLSLSLSSSLNLSASNSFRGLTQRTRESLTAYSPFGVQQPWALSLMEHALSGVIVPNQLGSLSPPFPIHVATDVLPGEEHVDHRCTNQRALNYI